MQHNDAKTSDKANLDASLILPLGAKHNTFSGFASPLLASQGGSGRGWGARQGGKANCRAARQGLCQSLHPQNKIRYTAARLSKQACHLGCPCNSFANETFVLLCNPEIFAVCKLAE